MQSPELLAPAGNFEKLKTALRFGADAVYLGGKSFSLRSFSDNFTDEELKAAAEYVHARGKKMYVTVNIFAKNSDFSQLEKTFRFLQEIGADAAAIREIRCDCYERIVITLQDGSQRELTVHGMDRREEKKITVSYQVR